MSARAASRLPGLPGLPGLGGFALVALAAASWGTWSLFVRPTQLPSSLTTPIMFAGIGLATLPFALRAPAVRWDRGTLWLIVAAAAFAALNMIAFFTAMQVTTVAIAVVTHYLAPVLIALAAPWVDGVATRGARPAAAVALAGAALMLEPWRAPADGAVLGAALGTVSAVCYSGNVFTVRRLAARIGAARTLCYHSWLAGALLAPFALGRLGELTVAGVALVGAGAVVLGAAAGVAFTHGLLRIGSARATVLTFIEPVVAVLVGAAVWHEPLRPIAVAGGALVLGAGIEVARKAR